MYSAAFAQAIVVGAKEFTEQLLVAEMTTQLLQASGFGAHKGTGFATTGIRSLQESGIDLYWEYTGTSLSEFNQVKEKLSPEEGFEWVKALDAKRGLVWLAPFEGQQHIRARGAASGRSRKGHEVDLGSSDQAPRRRGDETGFDRRIPDAFGWLEAASAGLWV
jgi:osmoprotectant transport system substrate-binding protein